MLTALSDRHFHDEATAYKFVEERVWPNGPICPHCGGFDRISKMGGKSTRIGTYKCYQCRTDHEQCATSSHPDDYEHSRDRNKK